MIYIEENPAGIKKADIVGGLASYKEADNISFPARQLSEGFKKYYPDKSAVIINGDNHSPDGTKESFLSAGTNTPGIYVSTPPGTPGKGYNFRNIFEKAIELGAESVVCVDADLKSITPEWVSYFLEPIYKGFDYVTPLYARHKYDGTITKNICYPLVYGLFGMNLRQPIGGDFALSIKLVRHLMSLEWHKTTFEYGIDIFLSMNAIAGGFNIAETGLGSKIHKPSAPKLGPMFLQVVGTAFNIIGKSIERIKNVSEIRELKKYGLKEMGKPQELNIDRKKLTGNAMEGWSQWKNELKKDLSRDVYAKWENIFSKEPINNDISLWVQTLYDMVISYQKSENKDKTVEAMRCLWFARAVGFMNQTWDWSNEKAEEEIKRQAQAFFDNRNYLIEKI
ncbi:glycosyl transferase [bacterium]|jgi:glycosyltransferase involved in cell wall biosynthesis|nr:glycosyl transferase [bacterium]